MRARLRNMLRSLFNSVHYTAFWGILTLLLVASACNNQPEARKAQQQEGENIAYDANNGSITLPKGFEAFVVADNIGRARHIAVRDNGDIYVALQEKHDGHGIVALRDTTGDGRADIIRYFGDDTGTGIGLRNGYLYFAPNTMVYRYPLADDELVPSKDYEVVAEGFPVQHQHAVKPFSFDGQGNMYVNVGAPSNACQEQDRTQGSPGQDPCPLLKEHGGIWQFSADKLNQDQMKDGHRYATGIRNAVANAWNPVSNKLYVVQHGRDQLHQLFPDLFTIEQSAELPAEEFFLVEDGDNFGWPYTYYDWKKEKKVLAPEYGGDGDKVGRADECKDPIMAFPGHWAPNDLLFYTANQFPNEYDNGAFIAFHGSWNRAPKVQKGYKVVFVPFDGALPSGDYQTFADGFAGTDSLQSPGNAEYRPMGLAQGPDGSLYISDSVEGRIWRVMYTGK